MIDIIFSGHIAKCAPVTDLLGGYVDRGAFLSSHLRGTAVKREIAVARTALPTRGVGILSMHSVVKDLGLGSIPMRTII